MTKILVLPGMGDIYWVFVKLQDFLKQHSITMPEIYTWELQPNKINRSADYIKRIPFVTYGGSWIHPHNNAEFNELYFKTTWKLENYCGFDYVLSCNGILRNGYDLNSFELEKYSSDWYFPLTQSQEEDDSRIRFKNLGNYIVAYFTDDGMYSQTWLKHLPAEAIHNILKQVHEQTGYIIVLSGGKWDKPFADKIMRVGESEFITNLVGSTSVNELFGLIKESKGMIGWCGGNTIMSVVFQKPTLIIWSKYFPKSEFFTNSVPPDSIGKWHEIKVAEQTSVSDVVQTMIKLCKES